MIAADTPSREELLALADKIVKDYRLENKERAIIVSALRLAAPLVRGDREAVARIIRCTVIGSTETASGVSGEYDAADAILSLQSSPAMLSGDK